MGIQTRNRRFKKFTKDLSNGKHILMVDVTTEQATKVDSIVASSRATEVGQGDGAPDWLVEARNKYNHFVDVMP